MNPDNHELAVTAHRLTTDVLTLACVVGDKDRACEIARPVMADELAGSLFIVCVAYVAADRIGLPVSIRPGSPEGPELHAMRLVTAASAKDNDLLDDFAAVAARQPWEWQEPLLTLLFDMVADAQWIKAALS